MKNVISVPRDKCIRIPQEKGRSVGRGVSSRTCVEMIIANPAHICVSHLSFQRTDIFFLHNNSMRTAGQVVIFPICWLLFIFPEGSGGQWLGVWALEPSVWVWIRVPKLPNCVTSGALLQSLLPHL